MSEIGARCYGPFPEPPELFTAEQDRQMIDLQRQLGNKWAEIGRRMNLDRLVVKNRCKTLIGRAAQLDKI
jgi:hypothetical protein